MNQAPTKARLELRLESLAHPTLKEHWQSIAGRVSNHWPVQQKEFGISESNQAKMVTGVMQLSGESFFRPGVTSLMVSMAVMKAVAEFAQAKHCTGTLLIRVFENGSATPVINVEKKLGGELYAAIEDWVWAPLTAILASKGTNQHKRAHPITTG